MLYLNIKSIVGPLASVCVCVSCEQKDSSHTLAVRLHGTRTCTIEFESVTGGWAGADTTLCRLLSNFQIKSIVLCAHDLNLKRISLMDAAFCVLLCILHVHKSQSNFQQMRHSPINLYNYKSL